MATLAQSPSGSLNRGLSPAWGVGADCPLPGAVLGGERGVCVCREQAEVEVQDPKARAKANWLRAFNKVCMQLQEVSNPAAARRTHAGPGDAAPSRARASSRHVRSPNPTDIPHPEGSGDLGNPTSGGPSKPVHAKRDPHQGAGSAADLPPVCAACGVLVRAPPPSPPVLS